MTDDQQASLQTELAEGRSGLAEARVITLVGGVLAVILGLALAFIFRNNIAGPVVRLTGVAERIRGGDLEARAPVESGDEIGVLAAAFNSMTAKLSDTLAAVRAEKRRADDLLEVVIPIGVDLTAQQDFNQLLEKMLLEAKSFCHADAGILYLREAETLKPAIVRNDALGMALGGPSAEQAVDIPPLLLSDEQEDRRNVAVQAALTGLPINIPDLGQADDFAPPNFGDDGKGYEAKSFLSIPLKSKEGQTLGVLELINAQGPNTGETIPFDQNLQQMMESFSLLATAALEAYLREQSLKQEIQRLRIEVDENKRKQDVKKIVESDTFKDLQAKADAFRQRARRSRQKGSDQVISDEPGVQS